MAGTEPGGTPIVLVVPGPPSSTSPVPTSAPAIVVTRPRPHLPFTGFDVATAAVLAALLLAIGVLLLVTARQRRHPIR